MEKLDGWSTVFWLVSALILLPLVVVIVAGMSLKFWRATRREGRSLSSANGWGSADPFAAAWTPRKRRTRSPHRPGGQEPEPWKLRDLSPRRRREREPLGRW